MWTIMHVYIGTERYTRTQAYRERKEMQTSAAGSNMFSSEKKTNMA